jgi:hypothetical protein
MRRDIVAGLALMAMGGCAAQPKLSPTTCVVAHGSGFANTSGNVERATVARNGSRCVMYLSMGREGGGLKGEIVTQPMHGTATVESTPYGARMTYTPARDYVGSDLFKTAFGPDFDVTVQVDVVPLAGGS